MESLPINTKYLIMLLRIYSPPCLKTGASDLIGENRGLFCKVLIS